jgi:hypothetical protein
MRMMIVMLVVAGWMSSARAQEAETHEPRKLWVGLSGGLGLESQYDQFFMDNELAPIGAFGLDVGIQRQIGSMSFSLQGLGIPVGGVYAGRASVIIGHEFTRHYFTPCTPSPGFDSCSEEYLYRDVANVFGLKLGADYIHSDQGDAPTLEVGIGWRGQIGVEGAYQLDPVHGISGGTCDMYMQLSSFYFGFTFTALAEKDSAMPLLMLFDLGYASELW